VRYKNTLEDFEMSTVNEQQGPVEEPVKRTVFYDLSRKVMLAAIGAAAIASDEISNYVSRLAERGEIAEGDARKLIREVLDRRQKLEDEQKEERQRQHSTASKSEVDALNNRILELNKKIEELKKNQEPTGQG
jgi:polyhydroxyalkanoate synthesis regulator phasin